MKTLRFYAEPTNWTRRTLNGIETDDVWRRDWQGCLRAKAALKEIEEIERGLRREV